MKRVRELARALKIHLAVGFSELRGEQVYNSVVVFGPDGSLVSRYSRRTVAENRTTQRGPSSRW